MTNIQFIKSDEFFKNVIKKIIPNLPENIVEININMKVGELVKITITKFPEPFVMQENPIKYNLILKED